MARFQRVPFDLLPPEQQDEIRMKEANYKRQREMLLEQISEKQAKKTQQDQKLNTNINSNGNNQIINQNYFNEQNCGSFSIQSIEVPKFIPPIVGPVLEPKVNLYNSQNLQKFESFDEQNIRRKFAAVRNSLK